MTIEELKNLKEEFLTASQAASVLRMDTGRLIGYAKKGELPFPVVISGNRVKIPRLAFMKQYGLIEEEREDAGKLDEILKVLQHIDGGVKALTTMVLMLISETMPDRVKAMETILNGGTAQ
jgi:hypothetical protein